MVWPFLTDILRRKLQPLRDELLRRDIGVSQDQRLLTLSLPIFLLLFSPSPWLLLIFLLNSTLDQHVVRAVCLSVCLIILRSASHFFFLFAPTIVSFFLYSHHFHQLALIPLLSTLHIPSFSTPACHGSECMSYTKWLQISTRNAGEWAEGKFYSQLHKSPFRQSS